MRFMFIRQTVFSRLRKKWMHFMKCFIGMQIIQVLKPVIFFRLRQKPIWNVFARELAGT